MTYASGITLAYRYTYTAAGYKKTLTYPDGTVVSYTQALNGELSEVNLPGEGSVSVNDWKWLAPKQITLPGGTVQQFGQDGLLSLTSLAVKNPGQQSVLSLSNSYGKVRELSSRSIDSASTNYTYDTEQRLTQVSGSSTENYTLDAVSNRLTQGGGSGWVYDANHRLLSQGDTAYAYDNAGNLIKKTVGSSGGAGSITQFKYDGLNRLIEVQDGAGTRLAQYGYDPQGRRLWKEVNSVRTYFLYSDEGLIAEANSTGSVTTQYGWKPDGTWGTDPLFIKTSIGSGPSANVGYAYFHNDHLGTPLRATDKAGNVVWSASYAAFGQATLSTGNQILMNLRLPGQYFDAESGLHYNWHRIYDPLLGRYITEDPVGIEAGVNFNQLHRSVWA